MAIYDGPTPVLDAIALCDALLRTEASDRIGRANVELILGGLVAQRGDFDHARELVDSAKGTYEDMGQLVFAATDAEAMRGEVEYLANDFAAAERILEGVCAEFARTQAYSHLASRAGNLAEVLYAQDRVDESAEWTRVAETHSATDDADARVLWMPVRAKLLARNGALEEAAALARDAVQLAETSDALNRSAKAHCDCGEVLVLADRVDEARAAYAAALELYEAKGNVIAAGRVRSLVDVAMV
jgi:tetratricopeptide (TPR) repeat protein